MNEQTPGASDPAARAPTAGNAGVAGFSPLPTGYRLGELVVQSVLGAGEFAITYLAEHRKTAKRYVLKEYFPRAIAVREGFAIKPIAQHEPAFRWGLERFVTEARALQQVSHPSLVSIQGLTQHGGTAFAGMSYEQGSDLAVWLHEHKKIAPQDELDKLLAPLLDGLAMAHENKVLHLDLGPECIIVRDSGPPVLVDFGVFRVGLRRRLPSGDLSRQAYAAPELLSTAGGPVGPWTDIYSLAGLLYLAVTGQPPVPVVQRAHGVAMPSASSAAKSKYRPEFLAAIDAGLRMRPAERPRTVPEWSRALLTRGSRFSIARLLPARRSVPQIEVHPRTAQVKPSEPPLLGSGDEPAQVAAPPSRNTGARTGLASNPLICAAFGAIAGGLLGGLSSYAVALLRTDCAGPACAAPLMLPLAMVGAALGLWEGLRFSARRSKSAVLRDYDL